MITLERSARICRIRTRSEAQVPASPPGQQVSRKVEACTAVASEGYRVPDLIRSFMPCRYSYSGYMLASRRMTPDVRMMNGRQCAGGVLRVPGRLEFQMPAGGSY
jgi:hypothetical protein